MAAPGEASVSGLALVLACCLSLSCLKQTLSQAEQGQTE